MAALSTLVDELVEEVLLRLSPDDPAGLVRATLVCRRWRRLVSGPGFRRRFREFLRVPPMLGFLGRVSGAGSFSVVRFVPTPPFRAPRADRSCLRALDARHGRVLLHAAYWDGKEDLLAVWDPVTDEQRGLPAPPRPPLLCTWSWNAAVLCAASMGGRCDHIGCLRGPFIIVFVTNCSSTTFVHVYSSETGGWSSVATAHQLPCDSVAPAPSALVGDAVYFKCYHGSSARILEYNVATREVSVIRLTPESYNWLGIRLMASRDGKLGLANVHMSRLYLWLKEIGTNGAVTWAQSRAIDLDALLPVDALIVEPRVAAVPEGAEVVFLRTAVGVFIVDLKSGQIKKLGEGYYYYDIVPYMSFCVPALGAVSTGEGQQGDAPSA